MVNMDLKNKLSDNLGFTGVEGPAGCSALVKAEDPQAEIERLQRKKTFQCQPN
jgi:hypothetical protein